MIVSHARDRVEQLEQLKILRIQDQRQSNRWTPGAGQAAPQDLFATTLAHDHRSQVGKLFIGRHVFGAKMTGPLFVHCADRADTLSGDLQGRHQHITKTCPGGFLDI